MYATAVRQCVSLQRLLLSFQVSNKRNLFTDDFHGLPKFLSDRRKLNRRHGLFAENKTEREFQRDFLRKKIPLRFEDLEDVEEWKLFYYNVETEEEAEFGRRFLRNWIKTTEFYPIFLSAYLKSCLYRDLKDSVVRLWLEDDALRSVYPYSALYSQIVYNHGLYEELSQFYSSETSSSLSWIDCRFYTAALYWIGTKEALNTAKNVFNAHRRDTGSRTWIPIYAALALKRLRYKPAHGAVIGRSDIVSKNVLLAILIETHRLEEALILIRTSLRNNEISYECIEELRRKIEIKGDPDLLNAWKSVSKSVCRIDLTFEQLLLRPISNSKV